MITQISQNDFRNAFRDCGRQDQFSYDALNALFEYYEEMSESDDLEFDLDVIAICCDWCEYDDVLEAARAYEPEGWKAMIQDDANASALEYLQDRTLALEIKGGSVLIANF